MISSASAQIEATGGENLRTTIVVDGKLKDVPDYATVQGILIGVVAAYLIVLAIIGLENHGTHFEKHRAAFEEGGVQDEADNSVGRPEVIEQGSGSGSVHIDEKASV
jgi:MFS transporter, SHS family, lactate transporter